MADVRSTADRKAELRAEIRLRRRADRLAVADADWDRRAERIAATICELSAVSDAVAAGAAVGVYEAQPTEPPTGALIAELCRRGAAVLVPHVSTDSELAWQTPGGEDRGLAERHAIPSAELPAAGCRVVITPALAVDREGARLGQGGGFFDRVIGAVLRLSSPGDASADRVVFIALVGPDEVLDDVPTEPHDQRVDGWVCA